MIVHLAWKSLSIGNKGRERSADFERGGAEIAGKQKFNPTPVLLIGHSSKIDFSIFLTNFDNMDVQDILTINPDIQFGTPVFSGTRVPVSSLFLHLEKGISIDEFLIDFPSVKKEQCLAILELAGKLISAKNFMQLYENAA